MMETKTILEFQQLVWCYLFLQAQSFTPKKDYFLAFLVHQKLHYNNRFNYCQKL